MSATIETSACWQLLSRGERRAYFALRYSRRKRGLPVPTADEYARHVAREIDVRLKTKQPKEKAVRGKSSFFKSLDEREHQDRLARLRILQTGLQELRAVRLSDDSATSTEKEVGHGG